MKWLFLTLFTPIFLRATNLGNEELSDIFLEGLLFIAVFAVMSIISFIVSKKQAKKYLQKNLTSQLREKKTLQTSSVNDIDNRITELSKLVDDGLLTEEEYQMLKQAKESA